MTGGLRGRSNKTGFSGEWVAGHSSGHPACLHRAIIIYYLNYVLKSPVKRDKHLPRRKATEGRQPPPFGNPMSWLMCSFSRTLKVFARKSVLSFWGWEVGNGSMCVPGAHATTLSLPLSCLPGTLSLCILLHPAPLSTVVCLGRVIKRLSNASCLIIIYDTPRLWLARLLPPKNCCSRSKSGFGVL